MKKKNPRLPNGFGSIRYLGKGRTNPFAVLKPSIKNTIKGKPIYETPIAYTDSWNKAFSILVMYHAGNYKKGDVVPEVLPTNVNFNMLQSIVNEVIKVLAPQKATASTGLSFSQVYELFYKDKFEQDKIEYSISTKSAYRTAFKNCTTLHDRVFKDLKHSDLQELVDKCPLRHASKEYIVNLLKQMYRYAMIHELVEKDQARFVQIKEKDDDEHGVPFSLKEIKILWDNKDDAVCAMILIMIYTGFRISEYSNIEINLKDMYLKGGLKTKAGKNRIVPIHKGIKELIEKRMALNKGKLLNYTTANFRILMYKALNNYKIGSHTPHDTRHTFSMLCDKYGVDFTEKQRMLGHAFSDVTNKVYGHADLDKLKTEISKIQIDI